MVDILGFAESLAVISKLKIEPAERDKILSFLVLQQAELEKQKRMLEQMTHDTAILHQALGVE